MVEQQLKQKSEKIQQKCRICLICSLSVVLVLSLTKIIFSNRVADWGRNLDKLKQETAAIQQENLILKTEIVRQSGGLTELFKLAQAEGYTDKPEVKYFNSSVSVAQKLP